MNDWWNYLAHWAYGTDGKVGAHHKYYARVAVGTKGGHTVYRYFYSQQEYNTFLKGYKRPNEKKKLTGAYGSEKHPNGRTVNYAVEEYTDESGKRQTRKKYVSREETDKLRDTAYRREKARNETAEEKKKRMKAAKKRYKKETAAARRKRAVQKGMQTVSRLLGTQLDFKKAPADKKEKRRYKKSGWKKNLIPGVYTRKLPKSKK